MPNCRNCGSSSTTVLQQGRLAPFFLKRVFDVEVMPWVEARFIKSSAVRVPFKERARTQAWKLFTLLPGVRYLAHNRSWSKTHIRVCKSCSFIGPDYEFSNEQLGNLYIDYRSDSYNVERCFYEPSYEGVAPYVGKDEDEVQSRLHAVDALLDKFVDVEEIETVLDWGGGEGKFIPTALRDKVVSILDISSEALVDDRYSRIEAPPTGETFDYLQMCHVLEHVVSPQAFLADALPYLSGKGFVYLEVPEERPEDIVQLFIEEDPGVYHEIHEHLNLFTVQSIRALGQSLGLIEVVIEKKRHDFKWDSITIISGLFTKSQEQQQKLSPQRR